MTVVRIRANLEYVWDTVSGLRIRRVSLFDYDDWNRLVLMTKAVKPTVICVDGYYNGQPCNMFRGGGLDFCKGCGTVVQFCHTCGRNHHIIVKENCRDVETKRFSVEVSRMERRSL
jgi:hypothetical protein